MNDDEAALVERAVAGEHTALELLLLRCYDRLARRIARRLPADLRSVLACDDIVQAAYVEAIRRISAFQPEGAGAFYRWLATIAEHKLIDAVRSRRGRGAAADRAAQPRPATADSLVALLSSLIAPEHSPSRAAARREAIQAVQVALAMLPEQYRRALWLRHIQGWHVAAIALELGRSERSVHMLCCRGLKLLRERMGSASHFLTTT